MENIYFINTCETNVTKFFEKLGYKVEEDYRAEKDGELYDIIHMEPIGIDIDSCLIICRLSIFI